MTDVLSREIIEWAERFTGLRLDDDGAAASPTMHPAAPLTGIVSPVSLSLHKPAQKKAVHKDRLDVLEHDDIETIKTNVITVAGDALMETYVDLHHEVTKWSHARKKDIGKLKGKQAPTGGGLLIEIAKSFVSVAKAAYPELAILEKVASALDVGGTVNKVLNDAAAESNAESKDEVDDAKQRAFDQLDDLVDDSDASLANSKKAIHGKVVEAMAQATPADIETLKAMGETQYGAIRHYLAITFELKRGEDAQPGVIANLVHDLDHRFKSWIKADFSNRHLANKVDKAIGKAQAVFEAKIVKASGGSSYFIPGKANVTLENGSFFVEWAETTLTVMYKVHVSDDPDRVEKVRKMIETAEKFCVDEYGMEYDFDAALLDMSSEINDEFMELYHKQS